MSSIEDNQYIVVLLLSCLILLSPGGGNYLSFKSREVLTPADDYFVNARDDQKFAENSDIVNLMAILTKTQQQLVETKAREKKAVTDKNNVIKNY